MEEMESSSGDSGAVSGCAREIEEKRAARPMTKAIIFDLDSCLAAADEVGELLFAPAFAAISEFKL